MAMHQTVILRGSYGDLTVDRATGTILNYDDHGRQCWDPGEKGYHDIVRVLPETLAVGLDVCLDKHGETDILVVGFIDDQGRVTNPCRIDEDDGMWEHPVALLPSPDDFQMGVPN